MQYTDLEDRHEQAKKLVDSIDAQLRDLKLGEDVGPINIRMIEAAARPDRPSKPDKPRIVGISCGVGVLLGIGLALLWDSRDPRLGGVEEIEAVVGVPVMALLPEVKDKDAAQLAEMGRNMLEHPRSLVSEAFRGLRTA